VKIVRPTTSLAQTMHPRLREITVMTAEGS